MADSGRGSNDLSAIRRGAYEALGSLASAFASPARLKIIQVLCQSARSVDELAQLTGESVGNASQHLQRLLRDGVVLCERRGTLKIYSISDPKVIGVWESLQDLGGEITSGLKERENRLTYFSLKPKLQFAEILKAVVEGDALLIDVREEREHLASPVSNARNIPLLMFKSPVALKKLGLSKKKAIYLFCRGRFCSMASTAVQLLRKEGYVAYRLVESPYRLQLTIGGKVE
jgi:DNA-binding transcriptional ArsR family regulator